MKVKTGISLCLVNSRKESRNFNGLTCSDFRSPFPSVVTSYSGVYNWLLAAGFTSNTEIYNEVIICEVLAIAMFVLGKFQLTTADNALGWLSENNSMHGS